MVDAAYVFGMVGLFTLGVGYQFEWMSETGERSTWKLVLAVSFYALVSALNVLR